MPMRDPVVSHGQFVVYFEPPSANRAHHRYAIFRGEKYIGATYSVPTAEDCAFELRRRTGEQPQYAGTRSVPAHRYQPPTGKYSISIGMHRTAEKNRAAKRAAMQFPTHTLPER